jgi:hypothetical protein
VAPSQSGWWNLRRHPGAAYRRGADINRLDVFGRGLDNAIWTVILGRIWGLVGQPRWSDYCADRRSVAHQAGTTSSCETDVIKVAFSRSRGMAQPGSRPQTGWWNLGGTSTTSQ